MVVNCGCIGLASGTWTARTLRVTCMLSILSYNAVHSVDAVSRCRRCGLRAAGGRETRPYELLAAGARPRQPRASLTPAQPGHRSLRSGTRRQIVYGSIGVTLAGLVHGPKLGQRRLVGDRREHDLDEHPDRDRIGWAADDVAGDRHVVVGAIQGDDGHDVG